MKTALLQLTALAALAFPQAAPQPVAPRPPAGQAGANPDIYVKVVRVDQARQEVEIAFAVMPKETRIVFSGDPKKLKAGDYVKMRLEGAKARVGGAELANETVIWKF